VENDEDLKDSVHFVSIPQSQTVNEAYYVKILKRLLEASRWKMPEL
jgi:hypothetical protein